MDTYHDNNSILLLSSLGEIMQLAEQIELLTQNRDAFNDTKLGDSIYRRKADSNKYISEKFIKALDK